LTDIAKAECLDDRITDNLAAIAIAAMNAQIGKPALRNGEHVTITTTEEPRDASGGLHD
jgi:hypothetical protein